MKTVEQIIEKIESEIQEKEDILKKMASGKEYWSGDEYEIIQGWIETKRDFVNWIKGS